MFYKQGDVEEVPLPTKSVDLALMSQSLHHAQRPEKALAEAFRILKPGGQLVVLDLKSTNLKKPVNFIEINGLDLAKTIFIV